LGFNHDFSKFIENCKIDKIAIEALGSVLAGSDRPLTVTTGLAGLTRPGQLATEDSIVPPQFSLPRVSEQVTLALLSKGVRASVIRLAQVHNTRKQGLITLAIAVAREKGISAYAGDGTSRWAAAHVSDVARLYRLALEKNEAGAKYHASCRRRRPVARYRRNHWPRPKSAGGFNNPGRSSSPFWVVGQVGQRWPFGLQRHNKEKAWLDPERAGTDSRLGTDGLLPGCIRRFGERMHSPMFTQRTRHGSSRPARPIRTLVASLR
jgi:hypothetical protein